MLHSLTYAFNAQMQSLTYTEAFSLVLSRPPRGPTTASPAWAISDDMTELPQLQSSCSRLLRQMHVLRKQMDAKLQTFQESYQRHFDRTVRCTQQFYSGQHIFVDRPPVQISKSAGMANPPLTELLPQTLGPFNIISTTLDTCHTG